MRGGRRACLQGVVSFKAVRCPTISFSPGRPSCPSEGDSCLSRCCSPSLSLPGAEHATVPTAQGLSAGHMVGLAGAGRLPVALALKGEDGHEGV